MNHRVASPKALCLLILIVASSSGTQSCKGDTEARPSAQDIEAELAAQTRATRSRVGAVAARAEGLDGAAGSTCMDATIAVVERALRNGVITYTELHEATGTEDNQRAVTEFGGEVVRAVAKKRNKRVGYILMGALMNADGTIVSLGSVESLRFSRINIGTLNKYFRSNTRKMAARAALRANIDDLYGQFMKLGDGFACLGAAVALSGGKGFTRQKDENIRRLLFRRHSGLKRRLSDLAYKLWLTQ